MSPQSAVISPIKTRLAKQTTGHFVCQALKMSSQSVCSVKAVPWVYVFAALLHFCVQIPDVVSNPKAFVPHVNLHP